jgi:secernin
MPDLTAKGNTVFGKNSDRPQGEVQEVVLIPKTNYAAGAKVQCTYIEIDQVSETQAVILSKPAWMWGAEMGSNDLGVVIGNEAVWSRYAEKSSSVEALLGMDLLRLGLERGTSARSAHDVITSLLEQWGQGGPCSDSDPDFTYFNSFLIADGTEAYVLETAGKLWAAERVEFGHRNISNCYTIGSKMDLMAKNLKEEAKAAKLWDGNSEFVFREVFSGSKAPGNDRFAAGSKMLAQLSMDKKFDVSSMMSILRDEESGICRSCNDPFPTASSQVSIIPKLGLQRPACHWITGTPDAKNSTFKPFVFTDSTSLSPLIRSPVFEDDPAKSKPRFQRQVDRRHTLFKRHENIYPVLSSKGEEGQNLRQLLRGVETNCIAEVEQVLDNFKPTDSAELRTLFDDSVDAELRFYK